MTTNPFADFTKILGDFKTPAFDVNQVFSKCRRDAETASAIFQVATESAQSFARRNAEIWRANAEQLLKASKEIVGNANPETAAAKQADLAKNLLESNTNNARELAEIVTKSAQEAFDLINKRIAEQVKEFSEVAGSAQASKKKAA